MKHRPTKGSISLIAVTIALSATASSVAGAQSLDTDDDIKFEEIIVTAKNREQNLQEVPLAITVFNNEALKARGILDARDVAQFTPSFNFYSGTGRSDPTALAVRGLAPNTSDERFQGLTTFVDGIAMSGQTIGIDLTQLERVEVIKGPQSATFGRATYSGAINYITRDPEVDQLTGYVRGRGAVIDSDNSDASYYIGGRLDFPIAPDLAWGSLNAVYRKDGAVSVDPGDGSKIGEEKTFSIAGTLLIKPTPDWKLKLRGSYSEEDDTPSLVDNQHPRYWLAEGVDTVALPRGGFALWPTEVPDARIGLTGGSQVAGGTPAEAGRTRERYFASLISEHDFNGYNLSYKGAYFSQKNAINTDFMFRSTVPGADPVFADAVAGGDAIVSPFAPFFTSASQEEFENTSHQILLLSPEDGRLRWEGGLYYFKEWNRNFDRPLRITDTNPEAQLRGDETIENYAVFGGASFDVSDAFTLSFEGRYQWETIGIEGCSFCRFITPSDLENSESAFLPRMTAEYKISENQLLYALYARGEKSARVTANAVDVNGDGTILDNEVAFIVARPEVLDNFEVGLKSTFLDGRAVLNIAGYIANVDDQQLISQEPVTRPDGTVSIINAARNVGGSDIWGFEVEGQLNVTDALSFSGGLGYARQEFTGTEPITVGSGSAVFFEDTRGDGTIVLDGRSQANVPRWTGNFAAVYSRPLGNTGYDLTIRGDAVYRGSFYADLGNIAEVDDAWRFNLRIAAGRETVEFALFARNLTNDATPTGAFLGGGAYFCAFRENDTDTFGAGAAQRCLFTAAPRPREVGLEATLNF